MVEGNQRDLRNSIAWDLSNGEEFIKRSHGWVASGKHSSFYLVKREQRPRGLQEKEQQTFHGHKGRLCVIDDS